VIGPAPGITDPDTPTFDDVSELPPAPPELPLISPDISLPDEVLPPA
jgi:hypothetical protein